MPADWAPILRNRSFADSAQEGDGFEPLVPQREGIGHFETTLIDPWPLHLREKHLPRRRDLEFAFGLLQRRAPLGTDFFRGERNGKPQVRLFLGPNRCEGRFGQTEKDRHRRSITGKPPIVE